MGLTNTKPNKWDKIDLIVGSRDNITGTGPKRVCIECQGPVYTSDPYPDDAPFICNVCFDQRPDSEVFGDLPSDPELMTDAQLMRMCQLYRVLLPHTTLATLTKEARQRGVTLRVLVRKQLITAIKAALQKQERK